jgi:hypothetical protein
MYKLEIDINDYGIVQSVKINDNDICAAQKININLNLDFTKIEVELPEDSTIKECSPFLKKLISETKNYLQTIPFVKVSDYKSKIIRKK